MTEKTRPYSAASTTCQPPSGRGPRGTASRTIAGRAKSPHPQHSPSGLQRLPSKPPRFKRRFANKVWMSSAYKKPRREHAFSPPQILLVDVSSDVGSRCIELANPEATPSIAVDPNKHPVPQSKVLQWLWGRSIIAMVGSCSRCLWTTTHSEHLSFPPAFTTRPSTCVLVHSPRKLLCTRAEVRGTTVYASDTLLLGDIEGISASQHRRCSWKHCKCFR